MENVEQLDDSSAMRAYMMGWRRGAIGLLDRIPAQADDVWNERERDAFDDGYDAGCSARRRARNEARLT